MDIFVINTCDADNITNELLREFQKKEISIPEKLKVHCFSYLMVDRILKEVYKIENREIVFDNNKPMLKNGGKCFSVSHSGEYIALGFSDNNCGIDIEVVNKEKDWKPISKRMKFDSKSLEEFYQDWTRYEANYKLGEIPGAINSWVFDGYYVTAVCVNQEEKFDLFMQNDLP